MITVITPTIPAVTNLEAMQWLRLPEGACGASEKATLGILQSAATTAIEERLKRKMLHSEILKEARDWSQSIQLPWSPFVEIIEFKYKDEDGNLQDVDPESYEIISNATPARINFIDGYNEQPDLFKDAEYPIQIRYKVGESDQIAGVPLNYKQVILMAVASGYMNRASLSSKTLQTEAMEYYINQLLRNKRVMRFG